MKIVTPKGKESWGYSITRSNGEKFTQVQVEMDDGSVVDLFVSNAREGYFRQVFVPWDFKNPAIV